MASESRSGDVAGLLAAANTLRNLMAYPAAVEVLDMVLAADSANVRALEQKALCLARQGGEFAGQAESVLDTAISLVGSDPAPDNESLSIMARLNKERWCRSWFDVGAPESDAQIEENCRLAAQESFFLWAAIDCCLDAFSQTQSYYTAINAATLLALAVHLNERVPQAQPRPASFADAQRRALLEKAAPVITASTNGQVAQDDEAAYWALATQLEWAIVGDDQAVDDHAKRLPTQATRLIRKAGLRRFLLDSTVGQFRIFRSLGFRPERALPALEALETALNFTPDPSLPRHRIVYLHGCVDEQGRFASALPGEGDPAPPERIDVEIKRLLESHHDSILLLPAVSTGSLTAAESAKALGMPYEFFSTVEGEVLREQWLSGAVQDLSDRFAAVRRKAREYCVLRTCVGESREGANDARLVKWVYDTAHAYGKGRATFLLDVEQTLLSVPSVALGVDPEDRQTLRLSEGDVARLGSAQNRSRAAPIAEAEAVVESFPEPEPEPLPAAEAEADLSVKHPILDVEIACFYDYCSREETRDRWNGYTSEARSFLMSIGLNWEPFGLVAPVMLERNTIGFELLTEGPGGMRYGQVMAERERLGISQLDVELVVLLKALNAVQGLRRRLRMALGVQADSLLMTMNVADMLVSAPEFIEVIARYRMDETSLFEINEGLVMGNVARVRQLADTYKLRLAMDDSNDMEADVRKALFDKVDLIKVDFKFTREQLGRIGEDLPDRIIEQLVELRQPDMPLVIEGIESEQDIVFIQNHWKREHGYLYCQGWAVQVSGLLQPFFKPVNTCNFPKGYRLAPDGMSRR